MSHRKTLGGYLLEESMKNTAVCSPLRRKSLAAPVTPRVQKEVIQNDDESERLARRRQAGPLDNSRRTENSERRVSLGLTAGLSANDVVEHYNKCLKLCAENKINSKNVFALSMIDYMAVLNKRDQNANNMQTAGTSLDVSTKIYSVRVDCVYLDVYKMAGDPGTENTDEAQASKANETNAEEPKVKQKKKRLVQDIHISDEALDDNIQRINLSAQKNNGDTQTTDLLNLVTFPIHAISGYRLHLYEDLIFDLPVDYDMDSENIDPEVEFDELEELRESKVCRSLTDFNIVGWSEADIPNEPDATNKSSSQNGHVEEEMRFDLDASVMSNAFENDANNTGMNYFDLEDAVQENVDRCAGRGGGEGENIVNFCETIVEKEKEKDNNNGIEYSYALKQQKQFHWAGPIHWRPKSVPKAMGGSRVVGACRQEGARRRKEINLEQTDESAEDFYYKLESIIPKRLQTKTIRQSWQEEKLGLPEDVHYDGENSVKLYLHSMRMKPLINESKRNEEMNGNVDPVLDEACENYNYDNLNDTVEYCSPNDDAAENGVNENGDDNAIAEGLRNGDENHGNDNDNGGDENKFDDLMTQGFTGRNLVALPRSTTQIQIAHSSRAKKIDMRQLKRSLWKVLTIMPGTEDRDKSDPEVTRIVEARNFSTVYKGLPILLGKNNAEALSPALAFSSLLHLANEKTLQIISAPDLSDLKIIQD